MKLGYENIKHIFFHVANNAKNVYRSVQSLQTPHEDLQLSYTNVQGFCRIAKLQQFKECPVHRYMVAVD